MTDGKKDQLKRKKTLEYELRRLYRAGELTDQQIAELKEAEFPFDAPVRRTAKSVVRIDDGKRWPSCSAAEKGLGITQGWMSDVCNMALRGKWVAIKNQFYCFESMYSPDMDLTEIRGFAGWIVNLETGEMFPTTTEAAKAAGTSRSVVLDHVKNKVKPQNKRFSYVRDWDGKVGRLVDLNVQMICLETDTIYHSYDEICAAIWSDGYGETRKEIVQKVGDAIRHGCPAFDICQQYPICILVAVLYDTFGEMSVRLFFALLDMVAVLFIWYQTFPKAGNRILHCAVSCVFGAVIVYSLRSTPRALDILCLAVSWESMEKYIKSRDIRFLFGFPFLGVCIANLHGALWPCAIMLPLAALLDSKLDPNARVALAVTILLTIASAMLNPYGLDVLSLPFKTIGTSDIATVAVPELKPMFSIVPVEAVILIVISVVPVIFHAKCLGFKKTVFSFETMMISGLLFLSLMTWRNELLLLGILMIVYSTWCWKLEPKCKVSSKMLSRIVLFSISVVALEFGAVLFYSTLSATDQKSISIERAFQAMREDGAVSGTAVLTDIDPGCRAELNGFKPYLDTRIEVFNGQNGQKNVLAEAGKALSSGSLSAICDDYGMDYAVLNYGINDVGIQDLKESGFKPVYSDNLTVCLKRSTV